MTKGQASLFIDGLKKLAEERTTYGDGARAKAPSSAPQHTRPAESSTPATNTGPSAALVNEKQIHAMERLAQQQGIDLDTESRRRFDVDAHGLTYEQASSLLRELQRPVNGRRAVNEPAL